MDCPRCGFNQPKDRYCANCGLNVEAALAKKPPLFRRIVGSPALYVSLIALLGLLLAVFLLNSKMPRLFGDRTGAYITSREAAISEPTPAAGPAAPGSPAAAEVAAPVDEMAPPEEAPAEAVESKAAASSAPEVKRMEIEFWEISREQVTALVDGAERLAEDQLGRAYVVHDVTKVREVLRASARPVGAGFREDLRADAQVVIETPPTASGGLRFGAAVQVLRWENARASLRFNANLAMTPPESPEEIAGGPTVRPVVETGVAGAFDLSAGEALVVWMAPPNRRPRAEFVAKAGGGPWQIFASPNFRVGETDWILTVRLR